MRDFSKDLVVIIGAARQGVALARYILDHQGSVRITDLQPASKLEMAIDTLKEYAKYGKIDWILGEHPLSLLDGATLVCPSGGVPLDTPIVQEARRRNILLSNDLQIFLQAAPCQTIGITGSAGKTTTTALVGRILQAWMDLESATRSGRVWVGGNIGSPLISNLDEMKTDDLAVVELSSFQLELISHSPNLACILNITPNHLDRHKSFDDYIQSKRRILTYQMDGEISILCRDDPITWSFSKDVKGQLLSFGLSDLPIHLEGTYLQDGIIYYRYFDHIKDQMVIHQLLAVESISLRGQHNLLNVMAACTICGALGANSESMNRGVAGFGGVQHRLEFVRNFAGADWYNDSIATAPERAIASVHSFEEPLILISGGRDKDLPWDKFVECNRESVDHLILFGEAAELIRNAFDAQPGEKPTITVCEGLHQAVRQAAQIVQPGYVVLLAPGGTSFDEFKDFEERGRCFAQWVREL